MSVTDRVKFPVLSFIKEATLRKIMKLGNVDDVHIYQEKDDERITFCVHIVCGKEKIYKKYKQIVKDEYIERYL